MSVYKNERERRVWNVIGGVVVCVTTAVLVMLPYVIGSVLGFGGNA